MPVNCSFKCMSINAQADELTTNQNSGNVWGKLIVEYINLNGYYLYLFDKTYKLYWADPAEVIPGTTKCNFPFVPGNTYLAYFSGTELSSSEINSLVDKSNRYKLLPIYVGNTNQKSSPLIRYMGQTLFAWIYKLHEYIEDQNDETPQSVILNLVMLYENSLPANADAAKQWLKKERYCVLPDGKVIDMQTFLQGIDCYLNDYKPRWQAIFDYQIDLIKNIQDSKNLIPAWRDIARKNGNPLSMIGSMHGYSLGKKYKEKLQSKDYSLDDILEEYFYLSDRDAAVANEFPGLIKTYFDTVQPDNSANYWIFIKNQLNFYGQDIALRPPTVNSIIDYYYLHQPPYNRSHEVFTYFQYNNKWYKRYSAIVEKNTDTFTKCTVWHYDDIGVFSKKDEFSRTETDTSTIQGMQQHIAASFNFFDEVSENAGMKQTQKIKFFVDNIREIYKSMKFTDETDVAQQHQLSYAYAAVMEQLAEKFAYNRTNGKGIPYGYVEPFKNGKFNDKLTMADCTSLTVIALAILGLVNEACPNMHGFTPVDAIKHYEMYDLLWARTPAVPNFKQGMVMVNYLGFQVPMSANILETIAISAVRNLMANKMFDVYACDPRNMNLCKLNETIGSDGYYTFGDPVHISSFDLTGMIGVFRHLSKECYNIFQNKRSMYPAYESHVYTFLNADGTRIAHSTGGGKGVERIETPPDYIANSYYYLKLRLPVHRKK